MNNKYYADIENDGFNEEAYRNALLFAAKYAQEGTQITRIVCYVQTKRNTGYLEPFFSNDDIKRLLNGNVKVNGFTVPLTIETKDTYSRNKCNATGKDIVLAFGMDLDDLEVLDDYDCANVIVAIPWLKERTMPWVERWNATEITGKPNQTTVPQLSLSDIAKVALQELSSCINRSTGISHHLDENRAKTYVRALHKYESSLDEKDVVSYLVSELNWTTAHANDVGKLVKTLNEGRYFQGGDKTGLQAHYKRWKEKIRQNK